MSFAIHSQRLSEGEPSLVDTHQMCLAERPLVRLQEVPFQQDAAQIGTDFIWMVMSHVERKAITPLVEFSILVTGRPHGKRSIVFAE